MRHPLPIAVFTMALCFAAAALAEDTPCTSNDDCTEGQVCSFVPCDINDADCEAAGFCIATEEPPPDCTTDADCADGERCIVDVVEQCAVSVCDCAEGRPDCECDTTEDCTTETIAVCGPPWAAPCDDSGDCGDGFSCQVLEACSCSGSDGGSTGDSEGGSDENREDCTCEPADTGSCVLDRVECTTTADCPDGFECVDESASGTCTASSDGSVVCDDAPATSRICVPPSFVGGTDDRALVSEASADDDTEPVDDVERINTFGCGAAPTSGAWPLALLLVALRRRGSRRAG